MSRAREGTKKVLDWEALEDAPNTRGAFSFLKSAADIVSIRQEDNLPQPRPNDQTTVGQSATVVRSPRKVNGTAGPKRCRIVQDGLSVGEAALYHSLWVRGTPEAPHLSSRTISIGWMTMSRFSGMGDKTCKRNATGLRSKGAIEVIAQEDSQSRTGRTYRIHSFLSILSAWKETGREWVTRDKSRRFVQKDGLALITKPRDADGDDLTTVAETATAVVASATDSTTVGITHPETGMNTTTETGVNTPTPLVTCLAIDKKVLTTTSTNRRCEEVALEADTPRISAALNHYWSADETAAITLIRACRHIRADARVEEIEFFIREKLELARTNRNITNPTGLILATVPQCFIGQTFIEFRGRLERQAAFEAAEAARKAEEHHRFRKQIDAEIRRLEELIAESSTSELVRSAAEKELRRYADWS